MQQNVVALSGEALPCGMPPSGGHAPASFTMGTYFTDVPRLATVLHELGMNNVLELPWQFACDHSCKFPLHEPPAGAPHVHVLHPRVSLMDPYSTCLTVYAELGQLALPDW
jgi:hypothetical protein